MRRTIIAFLVAPLWVPLVFGLYAGFTSPPKFFGEPDKAMWIIRSIAAGFIAGYLATFVLGFPIHLLLRAVHARFWPYALAWLGTGILFWFLATLASGLAVTGEISFVMRELIETVWFRPHIPLAAGALGLLVGASLWRIARPDRP